MFAFTVEVKLSNNRKIPPLILNRVKDNLESAFKKIILEAEQTQPSMHDLRVRLGNGKKKRGYEHRKPPTLGYNEKYGFVEIGFTHKGYVDDTGTLRKSFHYRGRVSGSKYFIVLDIDSDAYYWKYVEQSCGYQVITHIINKYIEEIMLAIQEELSDSKRMKMYVFDILTERCKKSNLIKVRT